MAFDVGAVGGGGVGSGFGLRRFLGWIQAAGAVVAAVFYVVVFGQARDHGGASVDLADAVEDDLGAAVVELNGAVDFNDAAFEAAYIADILQVRNEDDHRKRAGCMIFAEADEVDSFGAGFYVQDLTSDALRFADMLASFADGETVGARE